MGIRRFLVRLLVVAAVLVVVPALPASAAVSLGMGSTSAATFTVGDTGVPGRCPSPTTAMGLRPPAPSP